MKRRALVLCFALLGSFAAAEINDARAIALARPIVARFAPEALKVPPKIRRDPAPEWSDGSGESVKVIFGTAAVTLTEDGEFLAFQDFGKGANPPKNDGPSQLNTDAEAWKALEAFLVGLDVPGGLTKKNLLRSKTNDQPSAIDYTMLPRPYGYDAYEGNVVRAVIHPKTRRLMSLNITRGWTYEAPNVRTSPAQAIDTTRLAHGGDAKVWKVSLRYSSPNDPNARAYLRELRANKTMRLFYEVTSSRGVATVDSVTGELVGFFAPLRSSVRREPEGKPTASPKPTTLDRPEPISSNQEKTVGMWRGILAAVVLLLILGGGALARSLRLSN